MLREIKILKKLNNNNIVKLYDILEPSDPLKFNSLFLVLEYSQSDLKKVLKSSMDMTEMHVQTIIYNLIQGIKYMHEENIIHRDIKPGNILLNADCSIKICDFGLSRYVKGLMQSKDCILEELFKE